MEHHHLQWDTMSGALRYGPADDRLDWGVELDHGQDLGEVAG